MIKNSAGLLMYKIKDNKLYVFLAHPGGPFYKNKDDGIWSMPKGEIEPNEDILETAKREFNEETGIGLDGREKFSELGTAKLKSGKIIHAWAFYDNGNFHGFLSKVSMFKMEWPPKSGKFQSFPEVDKIAFFLVEEAKRKIHPAQIPFIERLVKLTNL